MTDSILDEFDCEWTGRPQSAVNVGLMSRRQRKRFAGHTCCGRTAKGKPCHRIGLTIRDNHAYCHDHDPGPEAA